MKNDSPTIAPPRRKRFQFSLRTLLIAVIAYGGLWVLTIKWGANQIARELAEQYAQEVDESETKWIKDGRIEFSSTAVFYTARTGDNPPPVPFKVTLSVVSRCPFWLHDDEQFVVDGADAGGPKHDYLWFFGAKIKLR